MVPKYMYILCSCERTHRIVLKIVQFALRNPNVGVNRHAKFINVILIARILDQESKNVFLKKIANNHSDQNQTDRFSRFQKSYMRTDYLSHLFDNTYSSLMRFLTVSGTTIFTSRFSISFLPVLISQLVSFWTIQGGCQN